jgi:subtilase-type serine protease
MKKLALVLSLALMFGVVAVNAQVKKQEVKKPVTTQQAVKTTPAAATPATTAPATATSATTAPATTPGKAAPVKTAAVTTHPKNAAQHSHKTGAPVSKSTAPVKTPATSVTK